jgi:mRNA export factor
MKHPLFAQHGQKYLFIYFYYKDGTKVVSVGCDKMGKIMDLNTGQTTQFAAHDAPIKSCKFIDDVGGMNNVCVTGSWDKTAKVWLYLN